jgi:DegV family protein with EDD domain
MKIAITLDSACDISEEVKAEYGFQTVPFNVQLGDKSYEDGKIDTTEIYDYVEKTGVLPKTSAINEETFVNFFSEIRKSYDAIIHFDISSAMSSAYQNAVSASKKVGNVYVIDSATLSTGIALQAIYAKELTEKYNDPKKIADLVSQAIPKTQASFIIERLDYLYKGGRCSSLAYLGANLLKLRPQIVVQNGKMKAAHKYRGKMEKVVADYCTDVLRENPNADKRICFITHSRATQEMIDVAYAIVKDAGFEKIYQTIAGCTVSSHCGKNTLGILFLNA